jgi:hypothetical protein
MTQLDICNAALAELGQKDIQSLNENSEGARLCTQLWTMNLSALLEEHPWGFATKRAALMIAAGSPAFGYSSHFMLPVDFISLQSIEGEDYLSDYKIEGGYFLTNASALSIQYTASITDTTKFSPLFADALAARLAWRMAKPITGSASEAQAAFQVYQERLSRAKGSDNRQGTPTVIDGSSWLDARS